MNYLTLGVIGHVDHGKTSLVKALTGFDTDRLKEEKERGISIALGYAYLDVPGGKLGVVDAPGHEKFIRTMVSGATGIRAVLLVLDVNEGVKPQTVEHIRIAELLGIEHGVVAITKCDTADADMRELAALDVQEFLEGTFLADAPLVYTSSQTGEGLDALKSTLGDLLSRVEPLSDRELPYLPVDRVFNLSGFGTVVTGTLRRGTIHEYDNVVIYPGGETVRIRELQSHGQKVKSVGPGMRTAVNVRGNNKLDLKRGDALAPAGSIQSGMFATCALTLLNDTEVSLRQRQQVRVLWGTTEEVARVHLLGCESIVSGETRMVQLQFERLVCSMFRERCVIRSYSPVTTIGGAVLLEFSDSRYKRDDGEAVRHAEILHSGATEDVLREALRVTSAGVVSKRQASVRYGFTVTEALEAWKTLGPTAINEDLVVDAQRVEVTRDSILDALKTFHAANPTQWGPSEEQLIGLLSTIAAEALIAYAVKSMLEAGTILNTGGQLHLAAFRAGGALTDAERAIVDEIEAAFRDGGLQPPGVVEVLKNDKERMRLYRYLVDKKTLYATGVANKPKGLSNTIVFHVQTLERAVDDLRNGVQPGQAFSPADAKEYINTSRKFLIPLLECMDRIGVTKRKGTERFLAG